jgi:putative transposase
MRGEYHPMKHSRYSAEQVAFTLRQAASGKAEPEVCRKMGISEQTFYRWKKRFAGMGVAEVRRLGVPEEENKKLKQLVADVSLVKRREKIYDLPRRGQPFRKDGPRLLSSVRSSVSPVSRAMTAWRWR